MLETTVTKLQTQFPFDAVALGDTVRIYHKPIAHIVPTPKKIPSWKKETPRLMIKGLSLSQEIQNDRMETVQ